MPQASMIIALGYLTGKIEDGQVTLENLEEYVATTWHVPDGQKLFVRTSAIEYALQELAKMVAREAQRYGSISQTRITKVLSLFGWKLTQGEVSIASLALLCNCSISEFEPPADFEQHL